MKVRHANQQQEEKNRGNGTGREEAIQRQGKSKE